MTLSVGGQSVNGVHQLSPKTKLVLGFVAGGADWVEWAVDQPQDAYSLPDDAALIEAVQSGIHGDGMTLLPKLGLEVAITRLWQLSLEALEVLAVAEKNGGRRPDLKTKRTLAANDLLPHAELATGTEFLIRWGVEEEPVFQAMGLADKISICRLLDLATETIVDTEAAKFAVDLAVSPVEFVDYFELYRTVADALGGKPKAARRRAAAQEAIELLEPMVTPMLRSPFAPRSLSPSQASALWRAWLETGRPMGFGRLSLGFKEIVSFAGGGFRDSAAAIEAAESYNRTMRELLNHHQPEDAQLSQDGAIQQFRVAGNTARAVVVRNRWAETLTIENLRKEP